VKASGILAKTYGMTRKGTQRGTKTLEGAPGVLVLEPTTIVLTADDATEEEEEEEGTEEWLLPPEFEAVLWC